MYKVSDFFISTIILFINGLLNRGRLRSRRAKPNVKIYVFINNFISLDSVTNVLTYLRW